MILQTNPSAAPTAYLFPGADRTAERTDPAEQTELSVIRFVQKLGIRPHLTGYRLLISTIRLALDKPELQDSLTQALYPAVARLHSCSVSAVERNIRKAIESAYDTDPERIHAVFYFRVKKPYVSEVISTAIETIRLETSGTVPAGIF